MGERDKQCGEGSLNKNNFVLWRRGGWGIKEALRLEFVHLI